MSFGTHTIPDPVLPSTVYIGMASTSHDNGAGAIVSETIFRSFSIEGDSQVEMVPITVEQVGGNYLLNWESSGSWILQTTTNLLTGPWVDVPTTDPPVAIGPTNRVDYYRLRIE